MTETHHETNRLSFNVDDLGNIYGWRVGRKPELPPVLIGSHLDHVRQGGNFDGALGMCSVAFNQVELRHGQIRRKGSSQ